MNKKIFSSFMRYLFSLLGLFVVGIGIFFWWAVGDSLPEKSELSIEENKDAPSLPVPSELAVATYNMGHGQGVKERAWDHRDQKTTEKQLGEIATALSAMNADVVLLQEVDIDSQRTYRINQIEFIKNKTGYPYYACAIVWQKNYIAFPYWPPSNHLGHVKSANCILSRFPMKKHERIILAKPKSNPFWYNWGYIDRGIERVDIEIGQKSLAFLNVHLEAWDKNTRAEQIKTVHNYLSEIKIPAILGGDFNTVLPDAIKKSGFSDDPDADYASEETFTWFFKNQENLIRPNLTGNPDNPFDNYTFPSNMPDRLIDHIFLIGNGLSFTSYRVFFEAKTASDHLPILARIKY
jgi:endonuclease/exonuclease/phosphatase family metal-dependent hydrolase